MNSFTDLHSIIATALPLATVIVSVRNNFRIPTRYVLHIIDFLHILFIILFLDLCEYDSCFIFTNTLLRTVLCNSNERFMVQSTWSTPFFKTCSALLSLPFFPPYPFIPLFPLSPLLYPLSPLPLFPSLPLYSPPNPQPLPLPYPFIPFSPPFPSLLSQSSPPLTPLFPFLPTLPLSSPLRHAQLLLIISLTIFIQCWS